MKTEIDRNLTDNDWTKRTQELKQIVSDNYNPADGTPAEFVDWIVDYDDSQEYDPSDRHALLNWAGREYRDHLRMMVERRIDTTPELEPYRDTILYDWPEGDTHLQWALEATVAEIIDWSERVENN